MRVSTVLFVQITLYMVISSSNHFHLVLRTFSLELRAPLIQSNARVAYFSFVRHIFSTSHEGGRCMHAKLALSIRFSEIREYMAQELTS